MAFIVTANHTDKIKAAKTVALKAKSKGAERNDLCWIFFSYPDFDSSHLKIISEILECQVIIGSSMPFIYTAQGSLHDIVCICFKNIVLLIQQKNIFIYYNNITKFLNE